jgi:hypothetical protein
VKSENQRRGRVAPRFPVSSHESVKNILGRPIYAKKNLRLCQDYIGPSFLYFYFFLLLIE